MSYIEINGIPAREIELGQEILPFAEDKFLRKETTSECTPYKDYFTYVNLVLPPSKGNSVTNFNLCLSLQYVCSSKIEIIPFHPKEGYTFDNDDLNFDSRKEKLAKRAISTLRFNVNPKYPLTLGVALYVKDFLKYGTIHREGESLPYLRLGAEADSLLSSLRLLLNADGLYEARFINLWKRMHILGPSQDFHIPTKGFYPVETGPLPVDHISEFTISLKDFFGNSSVRLGEGHDVRFADNEDERSKIGLRFILDQRALAGKA